MRKETEAWIEVAKKDLGAARELLEKEYYANIVLFHSQQCVEKSLKALFVENNLGVPKIHGILKLHNIVIEKLKIGNITELDDLNILDDIYIDSRYPCEFGILPTGFPTKQEAEKIFQIAQHVFNKVVKILKKMS